MSEHLDHCHMRSFLAAVHVVELGNDRPSNLWLRLVHRDLSAFLDVGDRNRHLNKVGVVRLPRSPCTSRSDSKSGDLIEGQHAAVLGDREVVLVAHAVGDVFALGVNRHVGPDSDIVMGLFSA